jgi:hypothetical protein
MPHFHEAARETSDPDIAFGQNESLFAYKMAASLKTTGLDSLTVKERAEDAVRTAVRQSGRQNIDIKKAVNALIDRLDAEVMGNES